MALSKSVSFDVFVDYETDYKLWISLSKVISIFVCFVVLKRTKDCGYFSKAVLFDVQVFVN